MSLTEEDKREDWGEMLDDWAGYLSVARYILGGYAESMRHLGMVSAAKELSLMATNLGKASDDLKLAHRLIIHERFNQAQESSNNMLRATMAVATTGEDKNESE